MKRFALKRITALVLALVMTLSLLPMNVWATEGEQQLSYKQLYWGSGDTSNLTYNDTFRGDLEQGTYEFRCFTEQNSSALVTSDGGYTLSTEGNIGTFSARSGDCVWNLTSATDMEGYLRVEKDNTVYRMKVTINNDKNVFTYQGVDIYTAYDNGTLGYGDGTYQDLSLDIHGGNGIYVKAPCAPNATDMSLYLKPADGHTLKITQDHADRGTLSPTSEGSGVYKLIVHQPGNNVAIEAYNEAVCVSSIEIMFSEQSGGNNGNNGNNGDNQDEFVKVFEIGNTLVKIRNIEGQSNVLDFERIEETGVPTILAVIKTDAPEAWRTVLTREDGLGIRFEIAAKEGEPNVKVHIADRETQDLAQDLADWSADTSYLAYNDPHERNRGGEYATGIYDEDKGETSILATTFAATYGCFWKYSESDVRKDGFVFKIVIADNELNFPVVVPDAAFVTTDRITAIPHAALDNLIKLKMSGDKVVCENGKVTYASAYPINATNYAAFTAEVDAAVEADSSIEENRDGDPMYNLLRVTTPEEGYVAKSYKGRFTVLREYSNNSTEMDLEYMWNGFGCEQVYTLTWKHATDATQPDIIEKLTIVSPSNPDLKWMDMIGQRIPEGEGRVTFTALPEDCGAEISYSNGTITTTFDNNTVLDVAPILESIVTITVPELNERKAVAVKYAGEVGIMGDPADPTLTEFTATLIERFKGQVDNGNELNVENLNTVYVPLSPLNEQVYGEDGEIKYFYSAHDGNRFLMLKWIFPDDSNPETPDELYEYMEVEATPYYCQWKTDLSTGLSNTPVVKPSAEVDTNANLSNIKLVTRIHPQGKDHGQYFFEMSVLDEGEGNTFIETYTGGYKIILPYSFIGVEDRAAAEATGKKAMINHYKNDGSFTLKDNNGTIFGTFTDRGIEFTVTNFSPFTVGLVEDDTPDSGDDSITEGPFAGFTGDAKKFIDEYLEYDINVTVWIRGANLWAEPDATTYQYLGINSWNAANDCLKAYDKLSDKEKADIGSVEFPSGTVSYILGVYRETLGNPIKYFYSFDEITEFAGANDAAAAAAVAWLGEYINYTYNGTIGEFWFKDAGAMKNGYPVNEKTYTAIKKACLAYEDLLDKADGTDFWIDLLYLSEGTIGGLVRECISIVQLPYYTLLTGVENEDAVEFIKTYVACHAYGNWYMTELVGAWQHNDETKQDVYNPTAAKAALDAYANLSDAAKKELASQVVKQGDPYNPNDFWTPTFAEWMQRQQTDYLFQTNPEAGTLSNPNYMTDASAKAFFKEYFDYSTYTDSGCVVIGFQLKDGRMAPDGGHLTQESLALAKKMMVAYNALSATAKRELDKLCVDAYRNMSFTGRLMDEYSNPYMSDPTGTMTKDALSEKAKQFLKEAGLILSDTGALSIDGAPIVEIEGEDRFYIDYDQKDTDKGLAGWNTAKTPLAAYYGKEFEGTSSAAPIWERDWELYDELNQLEIAVDGEEMWFESAMQYFRNVWEKMYYSGYYEEYMFHAAGYVAPVLGENFTVRVPAGLVEGVDYSFEYTTTDQENPEKNGVLTIHIKAGEKEHWRQAFYNSDKISRSSGILFGVEFLRPAGADHQANICGQGTTGVFAKYLDNSGEHPKELYESGYDLGENEKSVGNGRMMAAINQIGNTVTITPCDHYAVDHMLVVWYDSSKVANGYNTAVVGDRFMLRFRVVVDEDFNYEFNIPSKPAEVERVDIVPEGKWTVVKNIPGELIVRPLDGTISETLNGLGQTENGTYEFGNFTLTPPADGYVLDVEESNELTQEGYVKVLSGNTLSLYANAWNGGNRTTVFYTFVWEKAGAEDIVQELTVRVTENRSYFADIKNDNGTPNNPDDDIVAQPVSTADVAAAATITGMKKAYDEQLGFLETMFDQMPSLEDVKALYNREGVMMTPPQGTMYFRWTGGDGNQDLAYINIAEANEVRFGLRDGDIKPLYRNGTLSPEAQHELVFEYASIETLDVGDLTIYFAATQNYRWSAVEWLDENKNTIGYTYIYGKNGAIVQTETTESVSSEAELPVNSSGQLEKPIIIGEGMNFTANRYIQEGGGGKHWYLRLSVDEESNLDEVKGNWVYLPYDYVGLTWEQAKELKTAGYNPTIYHYAQGEAMPPEKIVGEYAPQGIKFNVKSFSPFVIDVSATEGNKGDNTEGNTGGTPGGCYPIVTPTTPSTPVEKPADTKPTTPAQPTTPPAEVTVPVSGEENTINVEASVSGSTATIDKVDMTKLEGVIGDDVAVGTVTIDFSDLESSETIDTVEIPANVVKEIAEAVADPNNDAESLEIILSDGASIEFDAAALAEKVSQAGGADITISIKQAVEDVLSAAQQAAVGDRVAFDINVTSGGVHISDMGGKITIHAPYELRDGETAEGIVVYYVDDEGNQEKCETSYDSVKKRVNWKTDHLSVYMIAHEAPATDDAPAVDNTPADDAVQPDNTNDIGLWIGVALAVLVVAIIVVVILIKRKKA